MNSIVGLLAVLGAAVLLLRLMRSGAKWLLGAAEVAAASAVAEASARRGDLTGMTDAREAERRARSARRREGVLVGVWLLWLSVPLLVGALPAGYAIAAPLWLLSMRTRG